MSVLSFHNYRVVDLKFKMNKNFSMKEKVIINPILDRKLIKIDENNFIISLGVKIVNKDNKLPFSSEIILEGFYSLKNWEKDENISLVKNNATAILFPYLRTTLSSVTQLTGIPPYNLPVINITKYFEKE